MEAVLAMTADYPNQMERVVTNTETFQARFFDVMQQFLKWSECEKTMALYGMMKKLSPVQAKFLARALQHSVAENKDSVCNYMILEQEANDPDFVIALRDEEVSKDALVIKILTRLPLLQLGNNRAKQIYLDMAEQIFAHSFEHNDHIDDCWQLLSYLLIHPAMEPSDQHVLHYWLRRFEKTWKTINKRKQMLAALAHEDTTDKTSQLLEQPILPDYTCSTISKRSDSYSSQQNNPCSSSSSSNSEDEDAITIQSNYFWQINANRAQGHFVKRTNQHTSEAKKAIRLDAWRCKRYVSTTTQTRLADFETAIPKFYLPTPSRPYILDTQDNFLEVNQIRKRGKASCNSIKNSIPT